MKFGVSRTPSLAHKWTIFKKPKIVSVQYYSLLRKKIEFLRFLQTISSQRLEAVSYSCCIADKDLQTNSEHCDHVKLFFYESDDDVTNFINLNLQICQNSVRSQHTELLSFLQNFYEDIACQTVDGRSFVKCKNEIKWQVFLTLFRKLFGIYEHIIIGARFYFALQSKSILTQELQLFHLLKVNITVTKQTHSVSKKQVEINAVQKKFVPHIVSKYATAQRSSDNLLIKTGYTEEIVSSSMEEGKWRIYKDFSLQKVDNYTNILRAKGLLATMEGTARPSVETCTNNEAQGTFFDIENSRETDVDNNVKMAEESSKCDEHDSVDCSLPIENVPKSDSMSLESIPSDFNQQMANINCDTLFSFSPHISPKADSSLFPTDEGVDYPIGGVKVLSKGCHTLPKTGNEMGPMADGEEESSLDSCGVLPTQENEQLSSRVPPRKSRTVVRIMRSDDVLALKDCGLMLSQSNDAVSPVRKVSDDGLSRKDGGGLSPNANDVPSNADVLLQKINNLSHPDACDNVLSLEANDAPCPIGDNDVLPPKGNYVFRSANGDDFSMLNSCDVMPPKTSNLSHQGNSENESSLQNSGLSLLNGCDVMSPNTIDKFSSMNDDLFLTDKDLLSTKDCNTSFHISAINNKCQDSSFTHKRKLDDGIVAETNFKNLCQRSMPTFQTASGKKVNLSSKAMEAARKLLDEMNLADNEEELVNVNKKVLSSGPVENVKQGIQYLPGVKADAIDDDIIDCNLADKFFNDIIFDEQNASVSVSSGPQCSGINVTARGKVRKSLGGRRSLKPYPINKDCQFNTLV